MGIPYTKTGTSLTLVIDFRPTVIPSSHPNYQQLVKLAADPKSTEADIKPLLDIPAAISNYTGGEIVVKGGQLFYRGVEVKNNLATIIIGFVKSGQPEAAAPFKKFLANCRKNPDLALVDTIYDWCVKSNMPITPDGELLAWKIVQSDYLSKAAGPRGQLDHSINNVVSEPREECDPNRNQTCSRGIHFASVEYIEKGSYGSIGRGDRIIAVAVNPQNITAIPTDYNLSKGRCCELTVVGEIKRQEELHTTYGNSKVYSGWSAPKPPKTRFPVQIGDVWKTRDGQTVTLEECSRSDAVKYPRGSGRYGYVFKDNGQRIRHRTSLDDLVELIKEAPVNPRNEHGFAVGQIWANGNGHERKIESIGIFGGSLYPIADNTGNRFTTNGRYVAYDKRHPFDLVKLIRDVD